LVLASSFAALSLGACTTTMTMPERARQAPQVSVAGTYLAANFAAAQVTSERRPASTPIL
jgi:hypothetical protein